MLPGSRRQRRNVKGTAARPVPRRRGWFSPTFHNPRLLRFCPCPARVCGHRREWWRDGGQSFIEYIPAENAWNPIDADGYMYIDCLWVSGSFKGHGYSNDLLAACIEDSKEKGKKGLCILSSAKKKPFLADPKYLTHKGFSVCDEADNGIQLWYLPFTPNEKIPKFKECARHPHVNKSGYLLFYTSQCPFNAKYVPAVERTAKEYGIAFKAIHIESKEDAQNAPTPITTYALFYNGEYLTNEQMNEAKFLKLSAR